MLNRQSENLAGDGNGQNVAASITHTSRDTARSSGCDDDQNRAANNNARQFLCGVVEGFYGKPWSCDQRRELLKRLKEFKLNSFMYAPKDDAKHRAKWRQLYNETEALELKSLIEEANLNNIDFYYSLAPGLDIVYTDENDIRLLCKKFDQLRSLGCKSFALLFDDIDPSINDEKDKVIFNDNYASAQVSITNLIYDHLEAPKFLFCPTEYCESRAVPNVPNSTYLNTIGVGLREGIDIMWSGCRVISRLITEESIEELTKVIRRPPVIWENLHANDYDKRRVFLGPYSGRSTKIIPKLRGVLTNPNCEYEANYIAMHTLAQWSKSTRDANQHNRCDQDRQVSLLKASQNCNNCISNEPINHKSSDDNNDTASDDCIYDPDRALLRAISDWLPHILTERFLPHDSTVQVDQRCDIAASEQIAKEESNVNLGTASNNINNTNNTGDKIEVDEDTVNSMVSSSKSEMDTSGSLPQINSIDTNSCDSCEMQDASDTTTATTTTTTAPITATNHKQQDQKQPGTPFYTSEKCDMCSNETATKVVQHEPLSIDNLALLVELFYLPFEHGLRGHTLLSDIKWLIENSSHLILYNRSKLKEEKSHASNSKVNNNNEYNEIKMSGVDEAKDAEEGQVSDATGEQGSDTLNVRLNDALGDQYDCSTMDNNLVKLWFERADGLNGLCERIRHIANTLIHECPNKLLIAELYPYLMELRDLVIMLMDFIKFLRHRASYLDRFYYSNNAVPKNKELIFTDEQEPWVHRGGLIGDVQRLLP